MPTVCQEFHRESGRQTPPGVGVMDAAAGVWQWQSRPRAPQRRASAQNPLCSRLALRALGTAERVVARRAWQDPGEALAGTDQSDSILSWTN